VVVKRGFSRRPAPAPAAALAALMICAWPAHGQVRGVSPAAPRAPDMHFAATRQDVADAMLRLARVGPNDVVYDLGSGDGRILILAAQKYGARGVGIEIDRRLVELSRRVAIDGEVADRVRFVEGDLFTADLSEATVVTLYLSEGINRRLEPKLKKELRSGARVVSHQFPIAGGAPVEKLRAPDGTDLFLWTIP
jgi:SAM-dependent methyltransferase